jgi:hypothetical protein
MYGPLGYQVAVAFVLVSLELAAVNHLPNGPVRYLEDPGGLVGRVGSLLHTRILPLEGLRARYRKAAKKS